MPNRSEFTEEQRQQLDRLLLEWAVEERRAEGEYWTVSKVDGYLTALIIGPKRVLSSEWLLPILEILLLVSQEELDLMVDLLMSLYEYRLLHLTKKIHEFKPLWSAIETPHEEKSDQPFRNEWCHGFMLGVTLQRPLWQPFYENEEDEHTFWLFMIHVLASIQPQERLKADLQERWPERRAQLIAAIPTTVLQIHGFWRERERERLPTANRLKRGRNESCPCGSGRKFKQCCGRGEWTRH